GGGGACDRLRRRDSAASTRRCARRARDLSIRLVSDAREMRRLPQSAESFLELLRHRHRAIMAGRPEVAPGEFKDRPNQFGSFIFVAPEDVRGTLIEGFRIYQRLSEPLHRAIF